MTVGPEKDLKEEKISSELIDTSLNEMQSSKADLSIRFTESLF